MNLADIIKVYEGSDGDATKALYARLAVMAPRGPIAMNLLRTCKASERAKVYRDGARGRGSYRAMAYDKKDWAIGELCRALRDGDGVVPSWGWGFDVKAIGFEHVLYVDIPGAGQVSFHTSYRKDGPDYAGAWDGVRGVAPRRICRWTEAVLDGRDLTSEGENDGSRNDRNETGAAPRVGEEQAGAAEPGQEAFDL